MDWDVNSVKLSFREIALRGRRYRSALSKRGAKKLLANSRDYSRSPYATHGAHSRQA